MGCQLIFVVETNKKCNSDWIYIKETINQFYQYKEAEVKLTPIYMDGKGKYKAREKQISAYRAQFASTSENNRTEVIYCFDCDSYDTSQQELAFLEEAKNYCKEQGYEFVWFCKDIEQVYWGRKVEDSQKKKEAVIFKEKKNIRTINSKKLMQNNYQNNTSNIMMVLNKFLESKE